ncbi:hypothetical protein GQ44DRAFT_830453 [Phaeosphaeriaceae sp. PMI808]|nr:hypothetical protein GQ44DRAFT_830453 [Phaeosphaeriaceae sp. PMI808]
MEQGVIGAFSKLWGTEELIVSYDVINMTLPNATKMAGVKPWPHVDQAPERKGLSCVQGFINLSEAGPKDGGLVDQGLLAAPHYDFYPFQESDVKWYEDERCKLVKVCAEPGDLILRGSWQMHYAIFPETDTIRSIIYTCYTPAVMTSAEDLKLKKEIFKKWEATTHWPHINIHSQGKAMIDSKLDPLERTEPLEKPELTDKLLKPVGVKAY